MCRLQLWRPLRKPNPRRLSPRVYDRLALCIHQHGLGPDLHVAAPQGFAGQLNELLGVLRRVEHGRELANRTPPIIFSVRLATSSSHSASGTGSTPPGAFGFFRVPAVFLRASVLATSRVIPNTAKVLKGYLQACACLAGWRDSLIGSIGVLGHSDIRPGKGN